MAQHDAYRTPREVQHFVRSSFRGQPIRRDAENIKPLAFEDVEDDSITNLFQWS